MIPLAYLMNGPDESRFFDFEDLGMAVAFLAVVAVFWFLAALMLRKKGKPLPLPPLFWIVAGIPAAFIVGFLVLAAFGWVLSVTHTSTSDECGPKSVSLPAGSAFAVPVIAGAEADATF